jgi:periplasmic protein TonB
MLRRVTLTNYTAVPLAVNINFTLKLNSTKMRLPLTIFLALFCTFLFGQKTKLIKDKATNEIYYVLKSNSNRHGEYQKFGASNILLIKGYYNNGIRDSIWEYYSQNGELIQKYNFKNNNLIYYKLSDSEKDVMYKLINGADNPSVVLDRPPIFLGGPEAMANEIIPNIQYPEDAAKNAISGRVFVSFIINKDGKIGSFSIAKPLGHGLDEEAIRVLKLLPENWIPGVYKGQPVDIELIYPVTFRVF